MSWSEVNLDYHEIHAKFGGCLKKYYPSLITGGNAVSANVQTAKFKAHLGKILDTMKASEEKLKLNDALSIPVLSSSVLRYIIDNSNLEDLYLLKSLYEDMCEYFKKTPEQFVVIDLFDTELPSNNKNILYLEEKNKDYIMKVEDLHLKIINLSGIAGGSEFSSWSSAKVYTKEEAFGDMKIKPTECADNGEICSSKPVLEKIKEITKTTDIKDALKAAKEKTNCDSESCVIQAIGLPSDVVTRELELNFKASGPRDSRALLSNFNIDNTLMRWAREFDDFFCCPFAMMDFDKTKESLATVSIVDVYVGNYVLNLGQYGKVKRPNRTFACVLNTDVSTGPGLHWVAIFADMRDENHVTLEYFNSTGNPIRKPVIILFERWRKELMTPRKDFKGFKNVTIESVTSLSHQSRSDNNGCGVYSLNYCRSRLEGKPFKFFEEKLIDQETIYEFRKYLFRDK